MAFFDEIGKKISQAGQTAVQKTKEMTDIARINSAIADEEKRINNNYFQIGKLYVAKHSTDFEEDFSGMITAVKESEEKIQNYRQQIQDAKGVVRCEKCGAEVSVGMAFCSSCGNAMPKQPTKTMDENSTKCLSCGAIVSKNMRFCTSCGKPMATSSTSSPQPNVEAPVANEVVETVVAPQSKKCSNCGADVELDLAFCTECGTKF